ncbi:hypothetical protein IW261DRAFT_1625001 [Armillaria novae-zelandiae]|uniref:Uncharacterized protein n=1 Tax=Armillaria novae-zelandiae TaxID=153914 RepID=A0AA39U839_9AGAR|nr:hypothetical protein IW261DRAFT_1625001 [Armillaria novae-zelandiae]
MATSTSSIPPGLTYADMVQVFDDTFNSSIFTFLLHGIYTGIVVVTLWNIYINKPTLTGKAMMVVIIVLYIGTTISIAFNWDYLYYLLVTNGQSFQTKYLALSTPDIRNWGASIPGAICTMLADAIIIWRCWIVWGKSLVTVILPVLLLISGITFKCIATYNESTHAMLGDAYLLQMTLYTSFTLASTLLCTVLIVFRIVTVARRVGKIGDGLKAYHHILEILLESSALYSISLVLNVAFYVHGDEIVYYFDHLAGITKGIAPTLLIGRVAAGRARPDDSWQGSIMSSLHFGTTSKNQAQTSPQDSITSVILDDDLEAQQEYDNEYGHHIPAESEEEATDKSCTKGLVIQSVISLN